MQALRLVAQFGGGVDAIQRGRQLGRGGAERGIEFRHVLRGGQLLIAGQQRRQQALLDRRIVAALDLAQGAGDQLLVALLVAVLAFGVRLGALVRQPLQAQCRTHQLGLRLDQAEQQVALAGGVAVGDRRHRRVDLRAQRLRHVLPVQPGQHRRFILLPHADRVAALEAFQLAAVALDAVLQRLQLRGVADLRLRVLLAGVLEHVLQLLHRRHRCGQAPLHLVGELGGAAVAVGDAGITGQHHVVAGVDAFAGDPEVRGRRVGPVVLRVVRRLAVRPDVGAQHGEVAAVARPHEVVHLVAVVADRARRRVDQPHVAQLQLLHQIEIAAIEHGGDAAAHAGFALAGGDQRLARRVHRVVVGAAGLAAGVGQHLVGDLVEADRDAQAEVRIGRQFLAAVGRHVTLLDQVALRIAVVLDHPERHVVVGQHQALVADEGAGGAADLDHRAERRPGQVGQRGRVTSIAGSLQRLADRRQLRRHPHALVRLRQRAQRHRHRSGPQHPLQSHRTRPRKQSHKLATIVCRGIPGKMPA